MEELKVDNEYLKNPVKNDQISITLNTELSLITTTSATVNSSVSKTVAMSKLKENFIEIDKANNGPNNDANKLTEHGNPFTSIRRKLIRTFNDKILSNFPHFSTYNFEQVQPMFNMTRKSSRFTNSKQQTLPKTSISDSEISYENINSNAVDQSKCSKNCGQLNICNYKSNARTMTKCTSNSDSAFIDEIYYFNSLIGQDDNSLYLKSYLKVLNKIIQSHCKNCLYFSAYICTKEMTNFQTKISSPYRIFYVK